MTTSTWRKSSYSGSGGNDCVEVTVSVDDAGVRDSKRKDAGQLTFKSETFTALLAAIRDGQMRQ